MMGPKESLEYDDEEESSIYIPFSERILLQQELNERLKIAMEKLLEI